jgi:hypothetical protein
MVAIWQTSSGAGSVAQWARTTDGGASWSPARAAPLDACANGPVQDARRASDPWVTFGPGGRVYLSALAWTPGPENAGAEVIAMVMVASPDGGETWERPVTISRAEAPLVTYDNLALAADPTRVGVVYATTTRAEAPDDTSYYGRLGFTRSLDGGHTWEPVRPITPRVNRERIGAPLIVVDPHDGTLYAVYHRRNRTEQVIGVMQSRDAGVTWIEEQVAAPHVGGTDPLNPVTGQRFELAEDIVQAAVTADGRVVIAYVDTRLHPRDRYGVSVVWSGGGTRWSPPVAIPQDSASSAWLPALALSPDGGLALTNYEANFTPDSAAVVGAHVWLHGLRVGAAGIEVTASRLVETVPLTWPGDYHGLGAGADGFLVVYGRDSDIVARRIPSTSRMHR